MITVPYLTSPKLSDSIVQSLRIDFSTYIHWLTYVYPSARLGYDDDGETYPLVSIGNESYRITPDDTEDAYCFFKQKNVVIGNQDEPNVYEIAIICWAQLSEVATLDEDETMTLANDFVERLQVNEAFNIVIDVDNPFEGYSAVNYHDNGVIMRKRTAFRIDFSIYGDNNGCATSYDQTYGHYGTKSSATDKGKLGQISYDDDYWYICVQAGSAGNAVWKKFPIMKT